MLAGVPSEAVNAEDMCFQGVDVVSSTKWGSAANPLISLHSGEQAAQGEAHIVPELQQGYIVPESLRSNLWQRYRVQ